MNFKGITCGTYYDKRAKKIPGTNKKLLMSIEKCTIFGIYLCTNLSINKFHFLIRFTILEIYFIF